MSSSLQTILALGLVALAAAAPLALAGPGASAALCAELGVRRLDGDLVAAADEIAAPRS